MKDFTIGFNLGEIYFCDILYILVLSFDIGIWNDRFGNNFDFSFLLINGRSLINISLSKSKKYIDFLFIRIYNIECKLK